MCSWVEVSFEIVLPVMNECKSVNVNQLEGNIFEFMSTYLIIFKKGTKNDRITSVDMLKTKWSEVDTSSI